MEEELHGPEDSFCRLCFEAASSFASVHIPGCCELDDYLMLSPSWCETSHQAIESRYPASALFQGAS